MMELVEKLRSCFLFLWDAEADSGEGHPRRPRGSQSGRYNVRGGSLHEHCIVPTDSPWVSEDGGGGAKYFIL